MKKSITPAAFLSYVHDDDDNLNGRITQFAQRLSKVTHLLSGSPFPIWQDRSQINWGDAWRQRIDSGLESVTFFLPVITPAYFQSPYCRKEFETFAAFEAARGRNDLILPLYLIEVDELADTAFRKNDSIARIFLERQYADWREFLFEPMDRLDKQFQMLAQQIKKAIGRTQEAPAAGETAVPNTGAPQPAGAGTAQKPAAQGPAPKTEPKTYVVDPMHRGDFASIRDAVAKAPAGARILVRPGLYQEGVTMNKPLEIVGDGPAEDIVVEASGAAVILFKTTMGRVANMTLRQRGGGKYPCVDITQGRLDLEDCDLQSESWTTLAIHQGAAPRVLRNRIHDGKESGIYLYENGRGTIEQNDIFGNTLAGIEIKEGADPVVRNNRIYEGKGTAIFINENGRGTIEQNDIFGNAFSGIEIKEGGDPVIRNNRIHDGKQPGIYILKNGKGTIEQNEIYNNAYAGIEVRTGGNPIVRNNRIYQNGYQGIKVVEDGRGAYENNTLRQNNKGPWDIAADCLPHIKRSGNIEE